MKKSILVSLSALLLLSGCSSAVSQQSNESENTAAVKNAESVTLDSDAGESELETISLTRAPEPKQGGAFISINSSLNPYEPSLMLYSDWTFVFTENCYEGLKTYRGIYTVIGDDVICAVQEQEYPEYAHKDELRFKYLNEYILQSEQDIVATAAGDLFVYVNQIKGLGTFYNVTPGTFNEGLEPTVTFNDDGTFEMVENLLAAMGEYKGLWLYDGSQDRCKVQDISFSGFAGDSVKEISFRNAGSGYLYLTTDLCGSRSGHIFKFTEKEGNKPEETAKPKEKKGTVFIVAGADSNRIKVRNGPGLSAADTGERKYSGDKVTVYEEVSKDGYTWYRIDTDKWMAGNGTSFGIKFE